MKNKFKPIFLLIAMHLLACNSATKQNGKVINKQPVTVNKSIDSKSIDSQKVSPPGKDTVTHKPISEVWMRNCNELGGMISFDDLLDTAGIVVNTDQIVISAKMDTVGLSQKREIKFKFIDLIDGGRLAASFNWDDFSKDSVIAMMDIINDDSAKVTWYGFYDTKVKERTWKYGFEMLENISKGDTVTSVTIFNCENDGQDSIIKL